MLLLPWSEFYLLRRLNYNLTTLALLNRDTMQVLLALVKTISCDFVLSFQMLNKPPVWLFISRRMPFHNLYCVMSWLLQPNGNFLNYAKEWRIFQSGLKPQTIFFWQRKPHCQKLSKIRKYPTISVTNFLSKYVSSFGLYCFVKFLFENSGE